MATLTNIKIKQGTTPILTAIVDGEALQEATVYLVVRVKNRQIVKTNYRDDGDLIIEPIYDDEDTQIGTSLIAQFSQEETLWLTPGAARVEAGWIFEDGSADKSNIGLLNITKSLYKEVMRYGEYSS